MDRVGPLLSLLHVHDPSQWTRRTARQPRSIPQECNTLRLLALDFRVDLTDLYLSLLDGFLLSTTHCFRFLDCKAFRIGEHRIEHYLHIFGREFDRFHFVP